MRNKRFNIERKKYIKEINSYLICDFGTRNKFISDLKSDIDEYIESNSITDFHSACEHFGKPRDIAKGFLENADTKKIKRKMDIAKVVLIAVVIAIAILAIYMTFIAIDAHNSFYGYGVIDMTDAVMHNFLFMDIGAFL